MQAVAAVAAAAALLHKPPTLGHINFNHTN